MDSGAANGAMPEGAVRAAPAGFCDNSTRSEGACGRKRPPPARLLLTEPHLVWWGQHFFKNLRRDDDQAVGQLGKLGSDSVSVGGGDQHPDSEILGGPNRLGKIPIVDDQHCGGEYRPTGKPDQIQSQQGIDSFLLKWTFRLLRAGDKMSQPELDAGSNPDCVQEFPLAGISRMGRIVFPVVPIQTQKPLSHQFLFGQPPEPLRDHPSLWAEVFSLQGTQNADIDESDVVVSHDRLPLGLKPEREGIMVAPLELPMDSLTSLLPPHTLRATRRRASSRYRRRAKPFGAVRSRFR